MEITSDPGSKPELVRSAFARGLAGLETQPACMCRTEVLRAAAGQNVGIPRPRESAFPRQ
jgi:hypothetical protein